MQFKSHPYYDNSDARDWLFLRPDDWTELESGAEKALQELLRADKEWLCDLALDRIRAAVGESYLAERPYPVVDEFLFFPIGEQGYQVYVRYFFSEWPLPPPDKSSADSDFWWAIINCPEGRSEAYVIGLGWVVP